MPKMAMSLRLAPDLRDAARRYKTTAGVPVSTQIDFALRQWLSERGALPKKTARAQLRISAAARPKTRR
jgi:hypothetical protein